MDEESPDIPWTDHSTVVCPRCNGMADYSTFGCMYQKRCGLCGFEECGRYFPAFEAGPPVEPVDVFIQLAGVPVSAKNLFDLKRLDTALVGLRPNELRDTVVGGGLHPIGKLYPMEIDEVRRRAAGTAYNIVVRDDQVAY